MFAYVGGLYFFLRTSLNSSLKCLRVVLLVCFKYGRRTVCKSRDELADKEDEEAAALTEQARLSLLVSLPSGYHSSATPVANSAAGSINNGKED